MKRKSLFALLALLLLGGIPAAQAQYSADPGSAIQLIGSRQQEKNFFGGISLLPATVFSVGGGLRKGNAGTDSQYGVLVDAEFGTTYKATKTIYQVGGWYWRGGGLDLYEVHARVQSSQGLGLQFGHINTSQGFFAIPGLAARTDASAYDIFALYRFSSYLLHKGLDNKNRPLENYHHWSVEFGAGIYIDTSSYAPNPPNPRLSSAASANYTFYVNGTYQVAPRLSLQLSEWVLRDRFQDLNRVAFGLGYSF